MPGIDYFKTESAEVPSWPQLTPGEPGTEGYYCRMISKLAAQRDQINALRLITVGLCLELYSSSPLSTGTEIMEQAAEISASFARLLTDVEGLLTTVSAVAKLKNTKNTSMPGSKL
jgi:hypothetical protein